MERRTSGSSRAGVGNARRTTSVAHPDGTIVEPPGSCLERTCAACAGAGGALIQRLGCTSARFGGATSNRRTRVECTRGCGLGRPEDRGTGSSTGALVVRTIRTTLRAGSRRATVELARASGASGASPMVTPG
jgi:hypothetical protein